MVIIDHFDVCFMFSFHYCYTHSPRLRYIPFFVSVYSLLCFVFRNMNVFMLFEMEKVPYCGKANRRITLFECLTVNDGLKWSFSSIHGIGICISFFFYSVLCSRTSYHRLHSLNCGWDFEKDTGRGFSTRNRILGS